MNGALNADGVALSADRLVGLRALVVKSKRNLNLAAVPGGFATRSKGHGLEVADVRDYVAGDDIRHLDRGTTARTGQLHVRQFQQERDRATLLIADFRASMFWGVRRAFCSVVVAETLAMIGWNVVETGGRVGLLAITDDGPRVVAIRGRVRGMLDVIGGLIEAHREALANMQRGLQDATDLASALSGIERISPRGAELVLASSFESSGVDLGDRLDRLSRRRRLTLFHVSEDVSKLPRGTYPIRLPDGKRSRVRISSKETQKACPPALMDRSYVTIDAGQSAEQIASRLTWLGSSEHAA